MLLHQETCCDHRDWNCCVQDVATMRGGHAAVATEAFVAQSRQMRGNTGMCTRGIADGNRRAFRDAQVPGLSGMHRAGVIPAGSGCRPGVDVLSVNTYGHRVLGIDGLHVLPTDQMIGHGISDFDTVIEDTDTRSNEQQVDTVGKAAAKHHVSSNSRTTCVDTVGPQQATQQQPCQTGVGETAGRSEHIWLVHPMIIAHAEGASRND